MKICPQHDIPRAYRSALHATCLFAIASLTACKLTTPDSFFDPTPDSSELLKSINVRNNGELWSGVVAGDLPAGVTGVDVKFDEGAWKKAEIAGSRWRVFIPTGAGAAAGKQRWQMGSKHALNLRSRGQNGNAGPSASLAFTNQLNKDANGDGYADVVVGAASNDGSLGASDKGAAYVFYGSASGVKSRPLNSTQYGCGNPIDCVEIQNPLDESGGKFGSSADFVGDINADGYADLVIGAPNNDAGTGALSKGVIYVFYGSSSGITRHALSANPYICFGYPDCAEIQNPVHQASGLFGTNVGAAGDVNGDGYADLVVGAYNNGASVGASAKGAVYIFYGAAAGITGHPLSSNSYSCASSVDCVEVQNPLHETNGLFGYSVRSAGDVNRDGYADLVVGARNNDGGSGASDKGIAYVFYGSASGITPRILSATTYTCAGQNDCTEIQNPVHEASGFFGCSVSAAADVNGDGYGDIIIGANNNDAGTGAADKGAAYIFYGSSSGIAAHTLTGGSYACSGPPDCTEIQNPRHEMTGLFGLDVSLAGDINRDGYADVVIGARNNDGGIGAADKGAAYVFYGSSAGITVHPFSGTSYNCNGVPDCTEIQNPWNQTNGYFAFVVNAAGDTNGDGYSDVLVGARSNDGGAGATSKGAAYIYLGSTTGITSHPLSTTPYTCSGTVDCTEIQNPFHEASGNFGFSVGYLLDPLFKRLLRQG